MGGVTSDLTSAAQDYLKVIWSAQEWSAEPVTTTALARKMGFSPSTVSEAVKRLTGQGLVAHARYGVIELTPAGRRAALAMVRRHRILETFLVAELGYTWDEVHDEAEVLEHAVSDRLVDALDVRLGHPTRDPHGDPIPTAAGVVPSPPAHPLAEATAGERAVVARISDDDPQLLRYVAEVGLSLDAEVEVLDRKDFAGTLTLRVPGRAEPVELGLPAAGSVWVARSRVR